MDILWAAIVVSLVGRQLVEIKSKRLHFTFIFPIAPLLWQRRPRE